MSLEARAASANAPERVLDRAPKLLEGLSASAQNCNPKWLRQQSKNEGNEYENAQSISKDERSCNKSRKEPEHSQVCLKGTWR